VRIEVVEEGMARAPKKGEVEKLELVVVPVAGLTDR
jgi:hypothetical protein